MGSQGQARERDHGGDHQGFQKNLLVQMVRLLFVRNLSDPYVIDPVLSQVQKVHQLQL